MRETGDGGGTGKYRVLALAPGTSSGPLSLQCCGSGVVGQRARPRPQGLRAGTSVSTDGATSVGSHGRIGSCL